MLNKRILSLSPSAGKDAVKIVLLNWVSLLSNIGALAALALMVQRLYAGDAGFAFLLRPSLGIIASLALRTICTAVSTDAAFMAGSRVKRSLRERIYRQLIDLGPAYHRHVST
ncbi:MAG: hypothetical protein LBG10_08250, partial [Treponema sp.]|nr:hypothetical protein [Treponema sp.]